MITVTCSDCDWTTDLELTSETNPTRCPKCGGTIMIACTDEPLYVGAELNPVLFADGDEE